MLSARKWLCWWQGEQEDIKAELQGAIKQLQEAAHQQGQQYDAKITDLQEIIELVKQELQETNASLDSTQTALGNRNRFTLACSDCVVI